MERLFKYFVESKKTNIVKPVLAVDKYHAKNKALSYFSDHQLTDLRLLYFDNAKKR
jgi:hypothetical protein